MIAKLRTQRPRRTITADDFDRMVAAGVFEAGESVVLADEDVYVVSADGERTPYRFTVEQYHRMIDACILGEDERIELIHGEMVEDMAIGDPHLACVKRLNRYFNTRYADRVLVSIQDPIRLDDSEPEPDCMLLVPRDDFYLSGKPQPQDAYLVIEVADSSFEHDRDDKGRMYAINGVTEYWIVNLNDETVHRYRGPQPDGAWAASETYPRGTVVTVSALPGVAVDVADILP